MLMIMGQVAKIAISQNGQSIVVNYHGSSLPKSMGIASEKIFVGKLEGFQSDLGIRSSEFVPVVHHSSGFFLELFATLLPVALIGVLLLALGRRGGAGAGGGMGVGWRSSSITLGIRVDQEGMGYRTCLERWVSPSIS